MRKFLLTCLILFLPTACLPLPGGLPALSEGPTSEHPWAGALRALDPADTTDPAHDLTAIYLRQAGDFLQIRVDLLDFQTANDLSLDIEIRDDSSLGAPPLDIHIPPEEHPARIDLDPLLATVIIEFPFSEIPARPRVDVSTPGDAVAGLTLDGAIPTQTAPTLLTFYDTFAARFPAEALRSWDGAHTGPRGERHGLKHLLDAVEKYQTPVVLLDLKDPETVSALDAMGVLGRIRQMESKGLLLLPEVRTEIDLAGFCQTCQVLELPDSPFAFDSEMREYQFHFQQDSGHLYKPVLSRKTLIPIATENNASQPTPDGPPLEVRRALLETALNADEKALLVLGGSLREGTWGSPEMVPATLAYFASRPYIDILTADELMNFPVKVGSPELRASPQDDSLHELETHYKDLTDPVLDFVTNWKGSPISSCETDIDQDGQVECVLANERNLAILDPEGARLTYLFTLGRVDNPPYIQLIGPSWQVAVGLSNLSLWDMSAGEAADPGAYPGAFADADDPFRAYEHTIAGNTVVFTSLDGARGKTFTLDENGLEVQYQTQEAVTAQLPLLVDPDTRFAPGWAAKYVQEDTPGGFAWGLENGPMLRIQADGPVEMRAFNESLSLLAGSEDPDFEYPAGHYAPFPMAVAELQLESGISTIQITVSP